MNASKAKQLLAVMTTLSLLGGCGAPKSPEAAEQTGTVVETQTVETADISTQNQLSGKVIPHDSVSIYAPQEGDVLSVQVKVGAKVTMGTTLFTLDSTSIQREISQIQGQRSRSAALYDEQIEQAQKQVTQASQQVTQAERQVTQAERQASQAENDVTQAEQDVTLAEQAVTQAEQAVTQAEQEVIQAEQKVIQAEREVELVKNQVIQAKQDVAQAEQQLSQAKQQLENTITLTEEQVRQAKQDLENTQRLFDQGAASSIELEKAEANYTEIQLNAEDSVNTARLNVTSRENELAKLQNEVTNRENDVASRENDVINRKNDVTNRKNDVTSRENDVASKKSELEKKKNDITNRQNDVSSREDDIAGRKNDVTSQQNEVSRLQTEVTRLQTEKANQLSSYDKQLADLQDNAKDMSVKATVDGTITEVNVVKGGKASPQSAAVVIAMDGPPQISVSVSETIQPWLQVGDTVTVQISALGGDPIQATVASVAPDVNPQNNLYDVLLDLSEGTDAAYGMFATVTIHTDARENVIVVPNDAIQTDSTSQYVFIVDKDTETAVRVDIESGLVGDSVTQVTSGLLGGEELVVTGQSYLSDGAAVRVVKHNGVDIVDEPQQADDSASANTMTSPDSPEELPEMGVMK